MVAALAPSVACRKCRKVYPPDLNSRSPWTCPHCQAKNPNLKRYYRSMADVCVLGIFITFLALAEIYPEDNPINIVITYAYAAVLLCTVIAVYIARMPWNATIVKVLLWTVILLAILLNVILPFLIFGRLLLSFALFIPYLIWLQAQTRKCTVTGTSPVPVHKE